MDILNKILEILTTPIVSLGGGSICVGTAIALIVKAIISPKKSDVSTIKLGFSEMKAEQENYVKKSDYDNLVKVVNEQNELQKEMISKQKNRYVREELENKRLAIENDIPKETIVEQPIVAETTEKPTKKRRF